MCARKREIIFKNSAFRLTANAVKQKNLTARLVTPTCLEITEGDTTRRVDIPAGAPQGSPGYLGDIPLLAAAYNLAMHELYAGITPEGMLTAGAAWSTVWTRDIAYAAALGTDIAAPEATRRSLESRVRDGIILQDTGTGGGWPVSTDRVVWALGAWAYYESSGDEQWLAYATNVLQNTLAQDDAVLRPRPLVPGETSFIDWREQSYPDWMTPADMGASYAFGTNVLHYMARRILARMLQAAGRDDEANAQQQRAAELGQAINEAFLGPNHSYNIFRTADGAPEMRTDALATALAVLCGLAGDHAEATMRALPRTPYGTPVFAPFKSGQPEAYHNRAIWPFVEAYVMMAHAEVQDIQGVEFSMAAMLRAVMAFGTNKENLHATTGAARDTLQNSDSQLWSIAGILGLFYHVLLGIRYEHNNLVFAPCIPQSFAGSHWFTNIKIRNIILDVHVNGYGTELISAKINGKPGAPIIPLDMEGRVLVELEVMPASTPDTDPTPVAREDLPAPRWSACDDQELTWHPVPGATYYRVYVNGRAQKRTHRCSFYVPTATRTQYRRFYVRAGNDRTISALSAPHDIIAPQAARELQPQRIGEQAEYPIEHAQAWLDTRPCTSHLIYETATALPAGNYNLSILYCNATASLRDGDTCALRELIVDGQPAGIIALPHNTEAGHWEDYTYTAPIKLTLDAGDHTFALRYTPTCANGNRQHNQCMVRHIRLIRMGCRY